MYVSLEASLMGNIRQVANLCLLVASQSLDHIIFGMYVQQLSFVVICDTLVVEGLAEARERTISVSHILLYFSDITVVVMIGMIAVICGCYIILDDRFIFTGLVSECPYSVSITCVHRSARNQ